MNSDCDTIGSNEVPARRECLSQEQQRRSLIELDRKESP